MLQDVLRQHGRLRFTGDSDAVLILPSLIAQEGAEDGVAILLLGNKTDCAAQRQVPTEEGERLAKVGPSKLGKDGWMDGCHQTEDPQKALNLPFVPGKTSPNPFFTLPCLAFPCHFSFESAPPQ